jgi:hypothetical protein
MSDDERRFEAGPAIEASPDEDPAEGGRTSRTPRGLVAETSEGARSCCPASTPAGRAAPRGRCRSCACPRATSSTPDIDIEPRDDETMIINMGPQHPSTHGVLRLMLELDGETVLRTKPIIGYLHTGMEKTGEELTYVQGATNVTRMDYLSPLTTSWSSPGHRGPARGRAAAAGGLDPHAHGRAAAGVVAPHVDGHQRHGPRVDVHDDLRVPRARDGPRLLREDDRACG